MNVTLMFYLSNMLSYNNFDIKFKQIAFLFKAC